MSPESFRITQFSIFCQDIEIAKKRQYELTHYTVLLGGAFIALAKIFRDTSVPHEAFVNVALLGLGVTGFLSLYMQLQLINSLSFFRQQAAAIQASLETRYSRNAKLLRHKKIETLQFLRDAPLYVYFLLTSLMSLLFAAWYVIVS